MKKSTKSIVIFGSLFIFSTTIFAMYISQKLNKEPYVEEKRIYKIDTVKKENTSEFDRILKEHEAKKENERMQKEYQEKVLKEQIENDKKEMEYLNKRYLEPYKKK